MDTFPKCSVCQQQFTLKGPVPYLLPCLHAVCETCVTSAAGGVISCSTCQREVNLTETSLQKDAVRQKEIFHLTVKHRPTELLCTNEDDGNQAVCWCEECEDFLCEYCQNMHSSVKRTGNHPVHKFGDIIPQNLENETNCSIHNRYPLDLFDKSCNMSICGRCSRGEHADHEVEDLDEAAEGVKQRIEQHGKDLSALLSRQQTHLQSIRQDTKLADSTQNTLRETIGHTFQSLRSQLDQREKELLIDLESQTREPKATLRALQTSCEEDQAKCTGVLDYIRKSVVYASKSFLLQLESSVEGITRTCLETAAPQTHDVPTAAFNTNGLSKLKSDMSGFGTITALKEEIIDTGDDKQTQTDDDYLADLEQKHEMELAELKSNIASDKERIELLQALMDKLNDEANSMNMTLAEKDETCKIASETIGRLHTSLIGFPTDGCVHLMKTGVADRCMVLHYSYGWSATRQYVELETDTQYNYQSLQEVDVKIRSQATSFNFKIQASNDAHVALLTYDGETGQNMYEIVLGAYGNTRSIIRNSRQGTNRVETFHSLLSSTEFRDFWISWEGGVISVGTGTTVGAGQFMTWTDPAPYEVNYLAVTTGFGSSGSWQFDSDGGMSSGVPIAGVATDNVYQYQTVTTRGVRLTRKGNCIPALVFWVRASNDAHIALVANDGDTDNNIYEIVIGGFGNTKSVIRESKQGTNEAFALHKPLSPDQHLPFWISYEDGRVAVGYGITVGRREFMSWTDATPNKIRYVSITTGFGSDGHWLFYQRYI